MPPAKDTIGEILSKPEVRDKLVLDSLKSNAAGLLLVFAVREYKQKPSKTKAVAIFDTFIVNGGAWGEELGELNMQKKSHQSLVYGMQLRMDWFRELRQEASSMNFVKRAWTSSSRAVAMPSEFDAFLSEVKMEGKTGDQLTGLITPRSGNAIELPGWKEKARQAKQALTEAGFDVHRMGLTQIS
jgi:hypothetical protein